MTHLFIGSVMLVTLFFAAKSWRKQQKIWRLHDHVMRMQGPIENRMSCEDFEALRRGLEADGWTCDPALYRFVKEGHPDFLPERGPSTWPTIPGENRLLRGFRRGLLLAQAYS
jgi:hypothetical protein